MYAPEAVFRWYICSFYKLISRPSVELKKRDVNTLIAMAVQLLKVQVAEGVATIKMLILCINSKKKLLNVASRIP